MEPSSPPAGSPPLPSSLPAQSPLYAPVGKRFHNKCPCVSFGSVGEGQGSATTGRLLRPWDHWALHACITYNQTLLNLCALFLPTGWCKSRDGLTHRLLVVKCKVWEHGWDVGGVNCEDALASFQGRLCVCALGWGRPEAVWAQPWALYSVAFPYCCLQLSISCLCWRLSWEELPGLYAPVV